MGDKGFFDYIMFEKTSDSGVGSGGSSGGGCGCLTWILIGLVVLKIISWIVK